MRRDKWILISSFCMLGLCALPYGCGGKAVDPNGGDGVNYTVGTISHGDGGYITTDGGPCDFFGPKPAYCGDGYIAGRDGNPFPPYGDGAFPPTYGDGAFPPSFGDGDGDGDGWDENHGDGAGPEGDSTPNNADGAAPEGAADGWKG